MKQSPSVALCELSQFVFVSQGFVCDPLNAVFHTGLAEIEQQSHWLTGQAQIGQQLFGMHRMHHFCRFQLHDNSPIDQQVDTKLLLQRFPIPVNGKRLLSFYEKASFGEFLGQDRFVCTFQKPRPDLGMHIASGVNDKGGDFIQGNRGIHTKYRIHTNRMIKLTHTEPQRPRR